MSTLLNESTLGTLDMAGDSYPREIDYEVDPEDGAILIHAVRLVKKSGSLASCGIIKHN